MSSWTLTYSIMRGFFQAAFFYSVLDICLFGRDDKYIQLDPVINHVAGLHKQRKPAGYIKVCLQKMSTLLGRPWIPLFMHSIRIFERLTNDFSTRQLQSAPSGISSPSPPGELFWHLGIQNMKFPNPLWKFGGVFGDSKLITAAGKKIMKK